MPARAPLMIALIGDLSLAAADYDNLKNPAVSGVILFARNYGNSAQLRRLTDAIRAVNPALCIAADQEGGRVQRFCGDGFTRIPPMRQLAQQPQADKLIAHTGEVIARELRACGIDLTFAPVLDIARGASAIIGDRAFSDSPQTVARCARAFIAGLGAGGMRACGKHFPGHGYAAADSHTELPQDERPRDEIVAADLVPFQSCIDDGIPLLMTAHIVYPAVDDQPATFSSVWLRRILRGEMNYRGLVVSDDLSMAGAAALGDIPARIRRAQAAGCDLLLVCQPPDIPAALRHFDAATPDNKVAPANWLSLRPAGI